MCASVLGVVYMRYIQVRCMVCVCVCLCVSVFVFLPFPGNRKVPGPEGEMEG